MAVELWKPSNRLLKVLSDTPNLHARDKVEIVAAFYHDEHDSYPSVGEVARALKISKQGVSRRILELIVEGRAIKIHGRLKLILSPKTHPLIRKMIG